MLAWCRYLGGYLGIWPAGTLAAVRLLGIPVPDNDLRRIVPTLLHGDETSRAHPA